MQNFWNAVKAFWAKLSPAWRMWLDRIVQATVVAVVTAVVSVLLARIGIKPVIPPPPSEPVFTGGKGWIDDPEAVQVASLAIERSQGMPIEFSRVAQNAIAGDDNHSVFVWKNEEQVLGRRLPSWDQGPDGTCVSMGWGRAAQDVLLDNVAEGREEWRAEVATEPIYGGSRVEVGGGRIRGDGSVGAWAARWSTDWGMLFRLQYQEADLRKYSLDLSRDWGRRGVPDSLEPEAKKFPLTVALVKSAVDVWAAIGNGYPVPVCSNIGFDGKPPATGVMEPRGKWPHCMVFRGRFTHPTLGRCVVVQNSWGNYLGKVFVETTDAGRVELPEGCFAIRLDVAGRMAAQGDTFAVSGAKGFPKKRNPWYIERPIHRPLDINRPFFATAL